MRVVSKDRWQPSAHFLFGQELAGAGLKVTGAATEI
jgi:hypothetical protein